MRKAILMICVLAITACSHPKNAEDNIKEILELSQYETLTETDYNKINRLIEECPEEIDQSLEENDAIYLFKMELLDAVHKDAFLEFGDTLALQKRVDICSWAIKESPEDSEERKAADSKLIETYTLWKKFDIAEEILHKCLENTNSPSMNHANCKYTEGWFYSEKGEFEKAKISIEEALDEFHELKDMGHSLLLDTRLTDQQFESVNNGIKETRMAIQDCENLLEEISRMKEL